MALKLVLGIDAGLNGVKVVGPKGEVYFRSIIVPEPPKMLKFTKQLGIKNRFEVEYDEERYILGEHAEFISAFNPIDFDSHSMTGSKNDETAFIKALGAVCRYMDTYEDFEDEDVHVYFSFGSPIHSAADEDEVIEIEDRFLNDGDPIEIIYNDIPLNITFKDILVVPEGVAANYAATFVDAESDIVYICDAGSQNVNLAALKDGTPNPAASGSLINGVEYFKEMYDVKAASTLAKQVRSKMEKMKWPKNVTVYVCGGYSVELATAFNALKKNPYHMEILKPEIIHGRKTRALKPIYANAAGMYNIARNMFADALASKG